MAEATITLKLTPDEFDTIRDAIERTKLADGNVARDHEQDIAKRSAARTSALKLGTLAEKLHS